MGGSAQEWRAGIDNDLVGGSPIELRLVMTKFGGDAATIGYEVLIRSS
ncbi:MAG: hypothetical protein BMS9Abin07_1305 [Acidimicrobiia bacterium]|nr:MAG: hypothetical protein BMS9Abin07_1305 [Acidimicrobiia bacterium]